jgi:MFS family permease
MTVHVPDQPSAVLRPSRRGLYGVLTAQAVAQTGTRVSAIAIPWFVLVSTGSATQTGVVAFCEFAPYVVAKALTGPMVDRVGPKKISIVADVVSALAVGLIPLLHAMDLLSFPVLLVLVAVVGAFRGPGDSAKEVFIPVVAEDAQVPLERATGLSGTIERLASTVGPGIAGIVVAAFGPINAIMINAVTFGLGAVIIAITMRDHPAPVEDEDLQGYFHRLGEGFTFLKQDKLLRSVLGMVAFTNLLDAAMFAVLLPLWARDTGHGPAAIGAVGSAFGICAVAGSITAAAMAHRLPRRMTYLIGFMVCGAPRFLVLGFDLPLPAVLVVMGAAGLGAGFLNPVMGAVFYERVPRHLLGRVNALADAMCYAGIPFGGVFAAGAVALLGFAPTMFVLAGAYFVATTLPGLQPEWKQMDRARRGAPDDHVSEADGADARLVRHAPARDAAET